MSLLNKTLKTFCFLLFMGLIVACAPSRKNPYYEKRTKTSYSDGSRLGRNKYYFSSEYQKKLYKNTKRK